MSFNSSLHVCSLPSPTALDKAEKGSLVLEWLGQAGFFLRYGSLNIIIDAYLSDSLAEKYKGKEFPHVRMMPPPIQPQDVRQLDWVLCTHRHSDHMDPGTLPVLAEVNPRCRFIVPRAEHEHASAMGLTVSRTEFVNAGEKLNLGGGVWLEPIPSAHEQFKVNGRGEHHYLGYILGFDEIRLYHSGDCVPYDGLAEHLLARRVDVALLPINGRSEHLRRKGVPGNFTFEEAVNLCQAARIPVMVGHHWGMFDFNTCDPEIVRGQMRTQNEGVACYLPSTSFPLVCTKTPTLNEF
jgi:L-ascorbate metabolism protein UlaG (beta-lactamase superfamily)